MSIKMLAAGVVFVGLVAATAASPDAALHLRARHRVQVANGSSNYKVVIDSISWDPHQTAVVVCDMWDHHTCKAAEARVGELAPRVNDFCNALRDQGALIIHCPSDTMSFYKDHPGRKLAQAAPKVETAVPLQRWCSRDMKRGEPPLPIDDSDGGCAESPGKKSPPWPWTRENAAIEIKEGDAITDSAEAFYLMKQRGITNVLVLGVHENMCILGRPFSIRQMVTQGQNVLLVRDLTDTMYNPAMRPQVDHFTGTDLVCEHIEKYWCSSITSDELLGGKPFRFRDDKRPEADPSDSR
jgi:nicotinamidase-related amidase